MRSHERVKPGDVVSGDHHATLLHRDVLGALPVSFRQKVKQRGQQKYGDPIAPTQGVAARYMHRATVVPVSITGGLINGPSRWAIVLPIKALTGAKTRLLPAGDPARPELALAFLQDVLSALSESESVAQVTVVTDDADVQQVATEANHLWAPESPNRGLNEAALFGASLTPPDLGIAIVAGDLPCLTGGVIDFVLRYAGIYERSFVADTQGIGTTMLMSHTIAGCTPAFGARSRAHHAALGYVELGLSENPSERHRLARVHRDVDTQVDLWDAIRIGVGPATESALQRNIKQ